MPSPATDHPRGACVAGRHPPAVSAISSLHGEPAPANTNTRDYTNISTKDYTKDYTSRRKRGRAEPQENAPPHPLPTSPTGVTRPPTSERVDSVEDQLRRSWQPPRPTQAPVRPSSYRDAVYSAPRTPEPVLVAQDRPILLLGDSNFTRYPFTEPPFRCCTKPGLSLEDAPQWLDACAPRPEGVRLIVVGLGVNTRSGCSIDELRAHIFRLRDKLGRLFPGLPILHVEAPARKLEGHRRRAAHLANTAAHENFPVVKVPLLQEDTGNPHYLPAERREAVSRVLAAAKQLVPGLVLSRSSVAGQR